MSATIAVLAWSGLLNSNYGGINIILLKMHIISQPIPLLSDPMWARLGLIMANLWLGFPYMMNVCSRALSSIPSTYYEAAELDGTSAWDKFIKITLPTIMTTALPLLISSFAFNFNNFGSAYLITRGGSARLWIQRIFICVIVAATLFPIIWIISASLATGDAFTQTSIFPKSISFDNYTKLIQETDFLIWVKNSMIICASVSLIQILMTSTGAYAFSRMKFRERTYGLMSLLILQMFPGIMSISAY